MAENEKALKRVSKQARFDLIPPRVMERLAEHYGRCIVKYPANNWRKGTEWGVHYAALQRHLAAYWSGEDYDTDPTWAEAGVDNPLHLDAALWNVVALIEAFEAHPERDDRFPVIIPRQENDVRGAMTFEHEETETRPKANQFRSVASTGEEEFGVYQCNVCGDYSPKLTMDAEGIRIALKWMQSHRCGLETTESVIQTNTFSRLKDDRVFAVMCDSCKVMSPQCGYNEAGTAAIENWKNNHHCKSTNFRI